MPLGLDTKEGRAYLMNSLAALEDLEYGWGTSGNELPMRGDIGSFASEVVFHPECGACTDGVPAPNIGLTDAGTIVLEFKANHKVLLIEIPCWGIVIHKRIFMLDGMPGEIEGAVKINAGAAELLLDDHCDVADGAFDDLNKALRWLLEP